MAKERYRSLPPKHRPAGFSPSAVGAAAAAQRAEVADAEQWDPSHTASASVIAALEGDADELAYAPRPDVEHARLAAATTLRRRLARLCAASARVAPPVGAFEEWLLRGLSDVAAAGGGSGGDPLLPTGAPDPLLAAALERAGAPAAAAREVAAALAKEARAAAKALAKRARAPPAPGPDGRADDDAAGAAARFGGRVTIARHRHSVDVAFRPSGAPPAKRLHKLSHAALDKLRALYAATAARRRARGDGAGDDEHDEERFAACVYCAVARYAALGGHGHQAALGPAAFRAARETLGAELELFASPFNCRWAPFCSAFARRGAGLGGDVDAPFGGAGGGVRALGALARAPPAGGVSVEANPPFEPAVIAALVAAAAALVAAADAAGTRACVALVLPAWDDDAGVSRARALPCVARELRVCAREHGFRDGAQHARGGAGAGAAERRAASYDTVVLVLMSRAARAAAPFGAGGDAAEAFDARWRDALARELPSEKEVAFCAKRGRALRVDAPAPAAGAETAPLPPHGEKKRKKKKRKREGAPPGAAP